MRTNTFPFQHGFCVEKLVLDCHQITGPLGLGSDDSMARSKEQRHSLYHVTSLRAYFPVFLCG